MPVSAVHFDACMSVVREAMLRARAWGWSGSVPVEQLADLMDAVHNIPEYLLHGKEFSCDAVKTDLQRFDDKWSRSDGLSIGLADLYDQVVSRIQS